MRARVADVVSYGGLNARFKQPDPGRWLLGLVRSIFDALEEQAAAHLKLRGGHLVTQPGYIQ